MVTFSDANQASDDIVLVVISPVSLKQADKRMDMGWPWRRATYSKACDFLRLSGAKVVAFNMFFTETSIYKACNEVDDDIKFASSVENINKSYIGAFSRGFIDDDNQKNSSKNRVVPITSHKAYKSAVRVEQLDSSCSLPKYKELLLPLDIFTKSFAKIGLLTAHADTDSIFRSMMVIVNHNNFYYMTLPFIIANDLLGWKKISFKNNTLHAGDRKIPLYDKGRLMRIKFYGSNKTVNRTYKNYDIINIIILQNIFTDFMTRKIKVDTLTPPADVSELYNDSAWTNKILDAIMQKPELVKKYLLDKKLVNRLKKTNPAFFSNKIVFVSGTAPGLKDTKPTPMAKHEHGFMLQANALDNILQDDFIKVIDSPWFSLIVTLSITFLLSIMVSVLSFSRALIIFVITLILIILSYIILYSNANILFDVVSPLVGAVVSFFSVEYLRFLQGNKQKSYIKSAFGQYLSPKVIDTLISDPSRLSLGGEMKNMTAVFTDLANFSSISEKLKPNELVIFLNEYLTHMCDIIAEYDGTIDKFEGDAIIAFWGAPLDNSEHAKLSCIASIKMQKQMAKLRQQWEKEGMPSLFMRVGINSGNMVVGNMGSKTRKDYTIMGDNVNLAARLEGTNKFYGTWTLCSHNTYEQVKDYVECREIDIVRVVGRKEPVKIYEVIDEKDNINKSMIEALQIYNHALMLYRERNYSSAISKFEELLKITPNDNVANTYIQRCKFLIKKPPHDDWDGIYKMETK
jgi:adenylate cyclase